MADQGSILQKLGGVRRVAFMAALFALATGFYHWQNSGAGDGVLVAGDPGEMAAHLDDEARAAVLAAADAGWTLEDGTWRARKSGRMVRATKIRSILDLGMAAARATQRSEDPAAAQAAVAAIEARQ